MQSFALPPPPPAVDDSRALTKPELVHLDHFLHPPPRLSRAKQRFGSLHRIERVPHPRKRPGECRFHLVGAEGSFAGEQQPKHAADAQREPVLSVEMSYLVSDLQSAVNPRDRSFFVLYI